MSRSYWMQRGTASAVIITTVALTACREESRTVAVQADVPQAAQVAVAESAVTTVTMDTAVPAPKPAITDVKYGDAFAVFRRGDYQEAAELFTVYADENDADAQGHYMLGLSAWKSGDHTTAERALVRAVELDGRSVKALTNLGRVLLEQARPADALRHMEQAVELAPQSHEVWRVYGNALGDLRRHEEALEAYRCGLVINGDDAWTMNNYGLVLIRVGRFDDALPALARAVELAPDSTLFRRNLDAVLDRLGERTDDELQEEANRFIEQINLWASEMEHTC